MSNKKDHKRDYNFVRDKNQLLSFNAIYSNSAWSMISNTRRTYNAFREYNRLSLEQAKSHEGKEVNYVVINESNEYLLINNWYKVEVLGGLVNGVYANEQEFEDAKSSKVKFNLDTPIELIKLELIEINNTKIDYITIENSIYIKSTMDVENLIVNGNENIKTNITKYTPEYVTINNINYPVINNTVTIENFTEDIVVDTNHNEISFSLESKNQKKSKNDKTYEVVLELQDINEDSEYSAIEYFYNEDVTTVYFNKNKQEDYTIYSRNKEYKKITIRVPRGRTIQNSGILKIKTDVYQLNCQRKAIYTIMERPSRYHKPLLTLADKIGQTKLDKFDGYDTLDDTQYKVLTNKSLKGNKLQREFVNKALNTPDFMILEGPPGSGKTTTILEFLYQVIRNGKKVLLCASTHVAIDNILEKILSHKDSKELLNIINPVRIGDENNISVEQVKKFTYNNIMDNIDENFKEIAEDSFNLVCGTAIGILRYPKMAGFLSNHNDDIVEPLFDYMIIDEASKTTFNEFLVPAIFAKHWIIVGDVKQLTPYVERSELTPTLTESNSLKSEKVRKAINFLMMMNNIHIYKRMNDKVYIMDTDEISHIDKFIPADKNNNVIALTSKKLSNIFTINESDITNKSSILYSLSIPGNIIIGEEVLVKKVLNYLYKSYMVMQNNRDLSHLNYFDEFKVLHFRHNKYHLNDNFKALNEDLNKKLEDEIIWRLIRIHELKFTEGGKSTNYYSFIRRVGDYMSNSNNKDYLKTISMLEEISLPSIIMLLQNGIPKSTKNNDFETILNTGFSDYDKQNRFLTLEYQYRMHPDISSIPRKFIYDNKALQDDSEKPSKDFKYLDDKSRFEIRDVVNNNQSGNRNEIEADKIMEELMRYINSNPKGNISIAILSFYNGQINLLRSKLQSYFKDKSNYNFSKDNIKISLNTVDKFQGQEADVVYLSMVKSGTGLGFLDSINRINVGITRAKEKLIIFGDKKFFLSNKSSDLLKNIFSSGGN